MPKIKMPKSAPSIDMTPMVDLAFLLVTFFMLSANFRTNEPVDVSTPSSISDKEVPNKHIIMVTVDKDGLLYFNATGEKTREMMLKAMMQKYGVQLSKEEQEEFLAISSFGCPMSKLRSYLDAENGERKDMSRWGGIPADSTAGRNELKDWIYSAHAAALETGKAEYEEEASKTKEKLKVDDFKPKFVLKVDGKAQYVRAKRAIDTFRDLNINNLYFVTSLEKNPNEKKPE